MLRFVIWAILIFKCLARSDIFQIEQNVDLEASSSLSFNEESLKKLLQEFGKQSKIVDKLAEVEVICSKRQTDPDGGFEYQVKTEVFDSPLLNKMLNLAEEKISDLAQIFDDDLNLVVDDAKDLINRRLEEKLTHLQEAMEGVKSEVKDFADRGSIGDAIENFWNDLNPILSEHFTEDVLPVYGSSAALKTESLLKYEIERIPKRANQNLISCAPQEKQMEDSLASVIDSEVKIAQIKESLEDTTVTECPLVSKHFLSSLESATEVDKKLLLNVSDALEGIETKVLNSINESMKELGM